MTGPAGLRAEIETATLAALAKSGEGFSRAAIAESFAGQGAGRATIFRWIAARMAARDGPPAPSAGGPGDRIVALIADATRRAEALPDALAPAALALRLAEIVATAALLIRHARGPGGRFVRPRLALDAADLLRRTVMNCAELAQAEREAGDVLLREPILKELAALLEPQPRGRAPKGSAI